MIHYKIYNFKKLNLPTCPPGCVCVEDDIVMVVRDENIEERWPLVKKIKDRTLKRLIYNTLVEKIVNEFEREKGLDTAKYTLLFPSSIES
jgi:hypothetical protein